MELHNFVQLLKYRCDPIRVIKFLNDFGLSENLVPGICIVSESTPRKSIYNTSVFLEICLSSFSPYCPVVRGSGTILGKRRQRRERRSQSTKSPRRRLAGAKSRHWAASKRSAVAACESFRVPQSLHITQSDLRMLLLCY